MKKIVLAVLIVVFMIIAALTIIFVVKVQMETPFIEDNSALSLKREEVNKNFYRLGNNWLRKNNSGLWEMYLEGSAFEIGVSHGILAKELVQQQESYFIAEIKKQIPSESYLKVLKYLVAWFNRDLENYIDPEFQQEIYGVSRAASDEFDYIAPKFHRIINYHGAHDIGHALQSMYLVGCTSFSVWDDMSSDSTLLIARNFDFYVGDDFAKDKIICFINPENGHKFFMITWGGMIGAVSGMNEHGLTVTLNAGSPQLPSKGKTPISLLARKILQYASNIEEAESIANNSETFVSESIMIGSAIDNKTVIIEKTPKKTGLFQSEQAYIICSNHFQSEVFSDDPKNIENIQVSDSPYRYQRVEQLIKQNEKIGYPAAAKILRNRFGLDNTELGMGNQKSINQLLAHHSIIFKPIENRFWISTYPWQLGRYLSYDLKMVFDTATHIKLNTTLNDSSKEIKEDPFVNSSGYQDFLRFKALKSRIKQIVEDDDASLNKETIKEFILSNPDYYHTYELIGDYFNKSQDFVSAKNYYSQALNKVISTETEKQAIIAKIEDCSR